MNPVRTNSDKDRLLKNWLTGDIDRKAEHDLESFAQDDPFLADALEGYENLPNGEHTESVTRLKSALRKRTSARHRGAGFYLVRLAAVGAVLLASWVVFQQLGNEKAASVAIVEEAPPAPPKREEVEMKPTIAQEEATFDFAENSEEEKLKVPNPVVQSNPPKNKVASPVDKTEKRLATNRDQKNDAVVGKDLANKKGYGETDDVIAAEEEPIQVMDEGVVWETEKEEVTQAEPPVQIIGGDLPVPEMDEVSRAGNMAPMVHKIVGQVTNDFGDPLTGASVFVEETQTGTVTDADGYFAIETDAIQPNLRISYLGYHEENLAVRGEDFIKIEMEENETAMDEVAVTSMKKSKIKLPEPKGGFGKLEKYIRKNLRRPDGEEERSGEVSLRFRISEKGVPTEFEVLQSLGEAHDEEAKRLLREGPKWENGNGRATIYVVKF